MNGQLNSNNRVIVIEHVSLLQGDLNLALHLMSFILSQIMIVCHFVILVIHFS